jgi:hypothetical protein
VLHDNSDRKVLSNLEDQFHRLTTSSGLYNTIDVGKMDSDRRIAST